MKQIIVMLCLSASCSAIAQVASLRWDVQQDRPVAQDWYIYQGETVDLIPRLVQGTAPVAISNTPVVFRYREAALTNGLYRETAATNPAVGTLTLRWTPALDAGAAYYDYQFIVGSNTLNPRVTGKLVMRTTLGVPASTSPPPAIAGCATPADMQVVSNALAAVLQVEAGARISGDAAGRTNHVAALAAEAELRIAGDAASIAASATNRVFRLSGTNCWQTVENGISYVYSVTPDTNRVRIVSASPSFNGPSAGSWFYKDNDGFFTNSSVFYCYMADASTWMLRQGAEDIEWKGPTGSILPVTLAPYTGEETAGSCVLDYGTQTNRAAQASEATVLIIADQVEANTDAIAAIPLPPTNAIAGWRVWDSGSNCYWRVAATNLRFYVWSDL